MIVSSRIVLRMRNVSDRSCSENQNTRFVFINLFPPGNRNVEKYCRAGQATGDLIIRRLLIA